MAQLITHLPILEELESKFKHKEWNEEMILRWCQQVETIYIADPDTMWAYNEMHFDINGGKVMLPANLYRLIDVYDPETKKRVRFNRTGTVIKQLVNYKKDVIAINYIGTPIDEDCLPLIYEDHYPACETFCKIQGFENEVLFGEINLTIYMDWKKRFDGMIQGVKGGFKNWTSQDFGDMMTIHGNEIPKIGYQPLSHKYFE